MVTVNSGVVNLKEKDRLCFSFCQDLSNKDFLGVDLDDQINIKWALFRLRQAPDIPGGGMNLPNSNIKVPGNYYIERIRSEDWGTLLSRSEQYDVFVAPDDYPNRGGFFHEDARALTIDLPNELKEQPHLYKHSTFQFCFLKNIIFSTNLAYMDVDENDKIRAKVSIYASPAGTYFIFQSGQVPFKWKLDVRQGITTWNLITDSIEAVQKTAKSIGGGILKVLSAGTVDLEGATKPMEKLTKDLITGKDGFKSMGLDREKINRNQELQTARLFQSTSLTGESMLEPSVFHSNSVQFPYSLYDFALRSFTPQYEARIYISKTLFNNLVHNNNANPITYPLDITFEKLGHILRPGFIQGGLVLDHDAPGEKMSEAIARGATFYNDKKEHFVNPKLTIAPVSSQVIQTRMGADFYIAQAITSGDEPWINEITRTKGTNYHQRAHFFITYEDGTNDHWLVLFPQSFVDNDLANGHHRGGFDLHFDKPVKEFIDVYTCIGCGASGQGYTALHSGYDGSGGDSLDRINKGLPYEPWFSEFTRATNRGGEWKTPSGKCLGSEGDVWEFTGQYIRGKDNKAFTEAYGFIPSGGTIQWTTKGGSSKIIWQKVPQQDDFSQLDWSPPAGSGGEIEIPLTDPEIAIPEPGEDVAFPEDEPVPDPFDPSGGEIEIPPIEPDLPNDIDPGQDPDEFPEIDPPEISPPEVDPNDPDTGQDPDQTPEVPEVDPGAIDPEDDEDAD